MNTVLQIATAEDVEETKDCVDEEGDYCSNVALAETGLSDWLSGYGEACSSKYAQQKCPVTCGVCQPGETFTITTKDFSTGFDFECCQCYVSWLPETGHTDDVQLGALGANDDYGSAIDPPSRRLADASSSSPRRPVTPHIAGTRGRRRRRTTSRRATRRATRTTRPSWPSPASRAGPASRRRPSRRG
mmetsp:Transcript_21053/g.63016  ORF Transcript_21053/g.63016 Transcript_21053/m.63016 type:complete len:188 (+) Transcript_21053:559-1122(+)